jgi:hypothetical protein
MDSLFAGFRKVLKKYDKITGENIREKWFHNFNKNSQMTTTFAQLESLIGDVELFYADQCSPTEHISSAHSLYLSKEKSKKKGVITGWKPQFVVVGVILALIIFFVPIPPLKSEPAAHRCLSLLVFIMGIHSLSIRYRLI